MIFLKRYYRVPWTEKASANTISLPSNVRTVSTKHIMHKLTQQESCNSFVCKIHYCSLNSW
jgi:hypothetical protein